MGPADPSAEGQFLWHNHQAGQGWRGQSLPEMEQVDVVVPGLAGKSMEDMARDLLPDFAFNAKGGFLPASNLSHQLDREPQVWHTTKLEGTMAFAWNEPLDLPDYLAIFQYKATRVRQADAAEPGTQEATP
eukprot:2079690-Lingulodinium_polyedra.AAC.1